MGARWNTGRLLRVFAVPLLLGGVLTGLGSTAASAATCQAWTGGQPANPSDIDSGDSLNGVDMLSACNVWVAGVEGDRHTLIEHWTGGSTWTVVPSPSPGAGFNFLTSINGISPTDIWAVGTDSNADGSATQGLNPALERNPLAPDAQPQPRDLHPAHRGSRDFRQRRLGGGHIHHRQRHHDPDPALRRHQLDPEAQPQPGTGG